MLTPLEKNCIDRFREGKEFGDAGGESSWVDFGLRLMLETGTIVRDVRLTATADAVSFQRRWIALDGTGTASRIIGQRQARQLLPRSQLRRGRERRPAAGQGAGSRHGPRRWNLVPGQSCGDLHQHPGRIPGRDGFPRHDPESGNGGSGLRQRGERCSGSRSGSWPSPRLQSRPWRYWSGSPGDASPPENLQFMFVLCRGHES